VVGGNNPNTSSGYVLQIETEIEHEFITSIEVFINQQSIITINNADFVDYLVNGKFKIELIASPSDEVCVKLTHQSGFDGTMILGYFFNGNYHVSQNNGVQTPQTVLYSCM
jgi:hypothetical protein